MGREREGETRETNEFPLFCFRPGPLTVHKTVAGDDGRAFESSRPHEDSEPEGETETVTEDRHSVSITG